MARIKRNSQDLGKLRTPSECLGGTVAQHQVKGMTPNFGKAFYLLCIYDIGCDLNKNEAHETARTKLEITTNKMLKQILYLRHLHNKIRGIENCKHLCVPPIKLVAGQQIKIQIKKY